MVIGLASAVVLDLLFLATEGLTATLTGDLNCLRFFEVTFIFKLSVTLTSICNNVLFLSRGYFANILDNSASSDVIFSTTMGRQVSQGLFNEQGCSHDSFKLGASHARTMNH